MGCRRAQRESVRREKARAARELTPARGCHVPTPLFININASDVASALVRSVTDMTAVNFAKLVIGDRREYDLYFVDGQGAFAPWSGDASYVPLLALGDCGNPSTGTFTLTYSGQTTTAIAFDASPAAVQAALEALSNIGTGDVLVTGEAGKYYVVTFGGALAGADVDEITGDGAGLSPSSVVSVDTITPGGSGIDEVQLIRLVLNPVSYADGWAPITNGWRGRLSARTLEITKKLAAESPFRTAFQVSVQEPAGERSTYLRTPAVVQCTHIDPESFAGADKPTFATVDYVDGLALAGGVFTREAVASSAVGNTNVSRPAGSHYHTALVTVSGAADVAARTVSVLTTNLPTAADRVRLYFLNPATAGIILQVCNATSGGTLIATVTTDGSGRDCFVDLVYSGSAWEAAGDDTTGMFADQNLAGLASNRLARGNLAALFSRLSDEVADFAVVADDDGTLFRIAPGVSAITATLPDPAAVGDGWMCALLKANGAAGGVVTSPATESVTTEGELMVLRSDGTGWAVLLRVGRPGGGTSSTGVINAADVTGLTGGSTNLDGLATVDGTYPVNSVVLLSYAVEGALASQLWKLVAGTDAEDADAGIVRPDDYASSTNEKVWKRIG